MSQLGYGGSDTYGFFGVTTTQGGAITDPVTTAATSTSPFGYATAAQANAIVTALRAVTAQLRASGQIASE